MTQEVVTPLAAMKQAVEHMACLTPQGRKAYFGLVRAIAELEKQEPVAWHVDFGNDDEPNYASLEKPNEPKATVRPLVFGDTSPPQRQQEPVAWLIVEGEDCFATNEKSYAFSFPENCRTELVVRNPPQRQWVGLTPQERDEINEQVYGAVPHHVAFHHAIEAKLKEKNT